jgi:hypothetical protein
MKRTESDSCPGSFQITLHDGTVLSGQLAKIAIDRRRKILAREASKVRP